MFPDKYRRVPNLLKPQQGGQQFFSEFLIRTANDELVEQQQQRQRQQQEGEGLAQEERQRVAAGGVYPLFPQADVQGALHRTTEEAIQAEMDALIAADGFQTQRGFNERAWYEQERDQQTGRGAHAKAGAVLPERVLGDDFFQSRYGYSLVKGTPAAQEAPAVQYSQLDLWGELPKYTRDMVFLYLISRRRNTYAVAYDYDGNRLLRTYTAGNRGLKGGDRGFRGDGSTDNGHQVTSLYLNDLLPRIRSKRAEAGRPMQRGDKVDLVVRVMGFYNGRQGAVRAVQDRASDFTVRYLEDITPFPANGPKMPRGVFR